MAVIFLTGFMGAGKTTVGQLLAEQYGYRFIDTDQEIERLHQCSVRTIFQEKGEAQFREIETEVLQKETTSKTVLSTGGGIVLSKANREWLSKEGIWVFLHVTPEEIYQRVKDDPHRPLLDGDPQERIQSLFEQRLSLYNEAPIVIPTSEFTPKEVTVEVMNRIAHLI
ncbi:shikimate kinase [Aureibacillus halotolerans]|uniref:Shikimate kinase n=1 Tax=Aureibacillus halotolerans TaxID=1508390 RepID=A0A4R6U7L2_9BACI|nr:shikimate kinase [Aureibacillus halotolerans]TDQ41672.1 shikimate kinase [Aureibacillus halotolerans]